jgi:hypothetical protein
MQADLNPDSMAGTYAGRVGISRLENTGRRHHAMTGSARVITLLRVRNGDDFSGEMMSCAPRMSATEVRLEEVVTKD